MSMMNEPSTSVGPPYTLGPCRKASMESDSISTSDKFTPIQSRSDSGTLSSSSHHGTISEADTIPIGDLVEANSKIIGSSPFDSKHYSSDSISEKKQMAESEKRCWPSTCCRRCHRRQQQQHQQQTSSTSQIPLWQLIFTSAMCPSYDLFTRCFTVVLLGLLLWGVTFCLVGDEAAPGGQLFNLAVLCIAAQVGGWVIHYCYLPPLLGMLLMGILFRNIGFVHVQGIYVDVVAKLRKVTLAIILIRAGLGLDAKALKRLSLMVMRLAVLPCVIEAVVIGVLSHYLLDFPWLWGFLLGSVTSAVSPAVVVPLLLSLRDRGYGVEKGITTLVLAAASIDDVIGITAFGIFLSIIFATGNLTMQILQGPLGLIMGIGFGILWGMTVQYLPDRYDPHVTTFRTLLIGLGGLLAIMGSAVIGFEGAGPLGCIAAAFVACHGWRTQGWDDDNNPVARAFAVIWMIFQPILFALIGAEIDVLALDEHTVTFGVICLMVALFVRIVVSTLVALGGNLNFKERLFVSLAWLPKATVQAALGPVALDIAREQGVSEEILTVASHLLTVAVLSILITAPIGSIAVNLTGPKLLKSSASVANGWQESSRPSQREPASEDAV